MIHHIDEARRGIFEHIEVVSDEVRLHERFLFGHRGDVDDLLAHEQIVFFFGQKQVGKIVDGRHRRNLGCRGTLLAVVDHLRLELAQLARDLIGRKVDGGIHIRPVLGHANHRASRTDGDLHDRRLGNRGVLLVTENDVGRHGLDIEYLERLADFLFNTCTQSISYRGLTSRDRDIHMCSYLSGDSTYDVCTQSERGHHMRH